MGYRNLQECVQALEANGDLLRIDIPLSPELEIGAIQRRAFQKKSPALLFTRPLGCRFPLLANLFGTQKRLRFLFKDSLKNLHKILRLAANPQEALRKPLEFLPAIKALPFALPKNNVKYAPVLAHKCALSDLPRLKSWPKDGGPFITLPLVHSEHPQTGKPNLGMYRIQLAGNSYQANEAGLHYQLKRGIGVHHAKALEKGQKLPVHIYVGGSPALTVAAVMPLPEGMSEFMFAGLLDGCRIALHNNPSFRLPVLAEADFFLEGEILPHLRPEGPFGDHLGYYSLQHDFPALKIKSVWHRPQAIWPFTTVGRPPQEDTVFGDFIHELTAPMTGKVFEGIREIHAVDAAGVHPLLLALGEERYTPWEAARKPRELLAEAMHLLGTSQTSLAKYVLIAAREDAPGLSTRNVKAFIAHMLERSDFSRDLHFIGNSSTDTLDYTGSALNEGSRLVWTAAGEKKRELGTELRGLPRLPTGFANPLLIAPGIIAIQGKPNTRVRGEQDEKIGHDLVTCLENWPERESFPLCVIVDDSSFCATGYANFLWVCFTRSDPETDIYGVFGRMHKKTWLCDAPLIIDARKKPFHAPELEEDPAIIRRLENLAAKNGPLAGII